MATYEIEYYDNYFVLIDNKTETLMGLRVFCEQEMYSKLNSGEFGGVLIMRVEEEKE